MSVRGLEELLVQMCFRLTKDYRYIFCWSFLLKYFDFMFKQMCHSDGGQNKLGQAGMGMGICKTKNAVI